ncbi:hypothetical protein AAG570_009188 [Ranatra chinensis]|uniref:Uncharacterized protein n=1 Tax=Ranatra chinensis TaxID=642074 RepID=A0ABD0YT02_9HEMI
MGNFTRLSRMSGSLSLALPNDGACMELDDGPVLKVRGKEGWVKGVTGAVTVAVPMGAARGTLYNGHRNGLCNAPLPSCRYMHPCFDNPVGQVCSGGGRFVLPSSDPTRRPSVSKRPAPHRRLTSLPATLNVHADLPPYNGIMATYATYRHIELDNVGCGKKRSMFLVVCKLELWTRVYMGALKYTVRGGSLVQSAPEIPRSLSSRRRPSNVPAKDVNTPS